MPFGIRPALRDDVRRSSLVPYLCSTRLLPLHRLDDVWGKHGKVQLDRSASDRGLHWSSPGYRLW
jgi:hypothetical protein